MRLPLSVTKGAPDDMRMRALAPSTSSDSRVASSPKATTSTGTGACVPVHELAAVDDDSKPVARGRHDLLAQQRATQSFDQIERAEFDLIRAVDREIDLPMLAEGRERNVRRCGLGRRALRGGNTDEAQTLPMPPRKRLDRKSCRRTAAESDHHVILDQLQRRLGGGTLECVAIRVGRRGGRLHDVTAAAAALARMSAIALA